MKTIDIEKLNQLVSRTDISGNDKVKWFIDFIDGKELHQQKKMYSEQEVIELLTKRCKHFGTSVSPFDKLLLKQDLEWFNDIKKL